MSDTEKSLDCNYSLEDLKSLSKDQLTAVVNHKVSKILPKLKDMTMLGVTTKCLVYILFEVNTKPSEILSEDNMSQIGKRVIELTEESLLGYDGRQSIILVEFDDVITADDTLFSESASRAIQNPPPGLMAMNDLLIGKPDDIPRGLSDVLRTITGGACKAKHKAKRLAMTGAGPLVIFNDDVVNEETIHVLNHYFEELMLWCGANEKDYHDELKDRCHDLDRMVDLIDRIEAFSDNVIDPDLANVFNFYRVLA